MARKHAHGRQLAVLGWLLIGSAQAATIDVGPLGCTLADAITAANTDQRSGSCPAGRGADVIRLPELAQIEVGPDPSGLSIQLLPSVNSAITIEGRGAAVTSALATQGRVFTVDGSGAALVVRDLDVSGGGPFESPGGCVYVQRGALTLERVSVHGCAAVRGGGIAVEASAGPVQLVNVTVSGNFSNRDGGGLYLGGAGAMLDAVALVGNSGGVGGGGGLYAEPGTPLVLSRSLVSGNRSSDDYANEIWTPGGVTGAPGSRNVFGHSNETSGAALRGYTPDGSDRLLTSDSAQPVPPGDVYGEGSYTGGNGTWVVPPAAGSPAVDFIATAACGNAADQRGVPRPNGPACDAGAFERIPGFADISATITDSTPTPGLVAMATQRNSRVTISNRGPSDASLRSRLYYPPGDGPTAATTTTQGSCDAPVGNTQDCRLGRVGPGQTAELGTTRGGVGSAQLAPRLAADQGPASLQVVVFVEAPDADPQPADNFGQEAVPGLDSAPDAFAFAPVTDVQPGQAVASGSVTITGINTTVPVTVSGGELSINGGPWTTGDQLANGDSLRLRQTASADAATATEAVVEVGSASARFRVVTAGSAFGCRAQRLDFGPRLVGVAPGGDALSAVAVVRGLASAGCKAFVFGTPGAALSVNGGAFAGGSQPVVNGDRLQLRVRVPASGRRAGSTSLSLGLGITTLRADSAGPVTPAAAARTARR